MRHAKSAAAANPFAQPKVAQFSAANFSGLALEWPGNQAPAELSLRNRACREHALKSIAAVGKIDMLTLASGGIKAVYAGDSARILSELSSVLSNLNPNLCAGCAQMLGNAWANPLSYYYQMRVMKCDICKGELMRASEAMRKSEFIRKAVACADPDTAWDMDAHLVPSFFAAEIVPNKITSAADSYAVEDVRIAISKHPTRVDMVMALDYPELKLAKDELAVLVSAYERMCEKRPDSTKKSLDEAFEGECKLAIDEAAKQSPSVDKGKLLKILLRHTLGFGAIEPLLKDERLQDIYVDSRSPIVHVTHSQWGECITNICMTRQELDKLATRLRRLSGRPLDASSPVLHAEIEELGIRVAGICPPSTYRGIGLAFRRRKQSPWTLPEFIQAKMLDAQTAGLLSWLVDGQATILITGPRASGKTSLLTALLLEIPHSTRIIAIEDTPEIPVDALQHLGFKIEHLKTEAWAKGFELSAEDALRTSLRLGESTLVLGEVRGKEAKALFEAMRVGAAGNVVMGTIHGASAYDTWDRVVNDLGVPSSSFKAVDVIVAANSIRAGDDVRRHRRVMAVTEVRKNWKGEPSPKDFVDIARFKRRGERWDMSLSRSQIIAKISEMKGISRAEAMRSIACRARMKADIVRLAKTVPEAASAPFVVAANTAYVKLAADSKSARQAYAKWRKWLDAEKARIGKTGHSCGE